MQRHTIFETNRHLPRLAALGLIAAFAAACATAPAPMAAQNTAVQNTATHDMECMGSQAALGASSDARERDGAMTVFAFYLGRLNQDGLTPEQIQTGMEKIALASDAHPELRDKGFAEACRGAVNALLKDMNAVGARDWDKMHAAPSRAASP